MRGGTQQSTEPSVAQQEVTAEQGDKGGSTGSNGPEQSRERRAVFPGFTVRPAENVTFKSAIKSGSSGKTIERLFFF